MSECIINRYIGNNNNDYYWLVQFYDKSGTVKVNEEYVQNNNVSVFANKNNRTWSYTPNNEEGVILGNITENKTVYAVEGIVETIMSSNMFLNYIGSSNYDISSNPKYAFDGKDNDNESWFPITGEQNSYISADFVNPQLLTKANITCFRTGNSNNYTLNILGKKSNNTWINCQKNTNINYKINQDIELDGNKYYGIKVQFNGIMVPTPSSGKYTTVAEVKVYSFQ